MLEESSSSLNPESIIRLHPSTIDIKTAAVSHKKPANCDALMVLQHAMCMRNNW